MSQLCTKALSERNQLEGMSSRTELRFPCVCRVSPMHLPLNKYNELITDHPIVLHYQIFLVLRQIKECSHPPTTLTLFPAL